MDIKGRFLIFILGNEIEGSEILIGFILGKMGFGFFIRGLGILSFTEVKIFITLFVKEGMFKKAFIKVWVLFPIK